MSSYLKFGMFLGIPLLLTGGAAGFFAARMLSAPAPPAAKAAPDRPLESYLPELALKGINYEVSEKGKRQWGFKAEDVIESKDGRTTQLNGLHGGVFYKDGKPYLHLKSGSATYDHVMKQLQMKGGVQVTGPNGLRFDASSLVWKSDKKFIVCPGPVRLQTEGGWITSNGTLTADLQRQTFSLQQVSGQFSLDTKGIPL